MTPLHFRKKPWLSTLATVAYDAAILLLELTCTLFSLLPGKAKLRSQQIGKLKALRMLERAPDLRTCYWLHAVSLGEVRLAEVLATKMRIRDPNCRIMVTTVTRGGHDYASNCRENFDMVMYYPADLSFFVSRILRAINPSALIVIEGDLWRNQIVQTACSGIPVLIANGRISESSTQTYQRLPWFGKHLFAHVDRVFAQTEEFAARFFRSGMTANRIEVSGNLKLGGEVIDVSPEDKIKIRNQWGLRPHSKIITFGSVHPDEMPALAAAIIGLSRVTHDVEVIIVPRHPDLFSDLRAYEKLGLTASELSFDASKMPGSVAHALVPVHFVRRLGVLKRLYSVSNIAFVGGSFCAVNGHNLIEPALCGIPVLFGPQVNEQKVLREIVLKHGAGQQAQDSRELCRYLQEYIVDETRYRRACADARKMVHTLAGAADLVARAILARAAGNS